MKKVKESIFVCSNCGNEYGKWQGQCNGCGEWNTLKEVKSSSSSSSLSSRRKVEVKSLNSVKQSFSEFVSTGISEFDRVLGKGIVHGSAVLFAGEPGIGKSTLLTQLVGKIGGLYVAGEESAEQIAIRVKRLGLDAKKFDILETNSVEEISEFLDRTNNLYKIVVVDSIQVMGCENIGGVIGSVGQIKESAFRLIQIAKRKGIAVFIVGHVTKEGDIAGPKLLEHMVDTVLYLEGAKNGDLRILRTTKNRFGPTDEVGIFKMSDVGLSDVRMDQINLTSTKQNEVGSAITVVMGGTRPMMVEIQALVTESFAPLPKRVFSGVDYNRGQLLVAVAQKVLGMPLYKCDVYISVTGGIKIEDTGADLAVIAAMWSSYKNKTLCPAKQDVSLKKGDYNKFPVFVGEVSLLGEVRKVRGMEKRIKEVEGFGRKLVEMRNVREMK